MASKGFDQRQYFEKFDEYFISKNRDKIGRIERGHRLE